MAPEVVEVATRVRPLAGHPRGGDATFVRHYDDGALLGVIDGLGHGLDAFFAAREAQLALQQSLSDQPDQLLTLLHSRLTQTVGIAVSLVRLYQNSALFAGVGNVMVRVAGRELVPSGGVVGGRFRLPAMQRLKVSPGQWWVMCSDGLSYQGQTLGAGSAETQADALMARFVAGNDDASVLVARWRSEP